MTELARPLNSVPEDDEYVVSAISPSSTTRRSLPSPETPVTTSNNPFSTNGLFWRSGYHRMPSDSTHEMTSLEDVSLNQPPEVDGLGISNNSSSSPRSHRSSFSRKPVGANGSPPETPDPFHDLLGSLSPPAGASSETAPQTPPTPPLAKPADAKGNAAATTTTTRAWVSVPPSDDNAYQGAPGVRSGADSTPGTQYTGESPGNLAPGTEFADDDYGDDEAFNKKFAEPPSYCWSKRDIRQPRVSWLSLTIYILSLYSTVMSGLWLVVSIIQPRWGRGISSSHGMLPSTATLLAAMIAKTIELSFVTVFVSCVGQVLTRRSFVKKARGMTLAEMTMRNWVFQPGSLITHCETLPYAGMTLLGVLSLTATVVAAFYTTASDSMVSPKLKFGDWEQRELSGYIRTSYANALYVKTACPSLVKDMDQLHAEESCMNVQFSGQSYRNLLGFMATWTRINENGTSLVNDLRGRPPGTMLLYDNTTMTGAWIETEYSNITAQFEKHSRIINNVTMAMPHPDVYTAATNKENGILQPDDLDGVGEYALRAGVVSPAINVMCVNMDEEELAPLVFTEWPHVPENMTEMTGVGNQIGVVDGWEGYVPQPTEGGKANWLNRTAVDDIFRWGEKYKRRPPVFPLYPANFNFVSNTTVFESDAIYLLGKTDQNINYSLCELRSWVTEDCSTRFDYSGTSGAMMRAHCEDPSDEDSYIKSLDKPPAWPPASTDWRFIGQQWSLSMFLGGGLNNDNASNARILTQLTLTQPELPSYLPSLAEALAAYASSSVVIGAMDSPFRHYWEYSKPGNIIGEPGVLQSFNASLKTQQYTSGHVNRWQGTFYVVLALVFGINMFCLFYFIMHYGMVTDFTEPQNLFTLAINSPPSAQLIGSCGGGPEKRDLVVPWRVAYTPGSNHYFFDEANESPWRGKYARTPVLSTPRDRGEVQGKSYKRLSTSRAWL